MEKFNKKFSLLFASFALMMGIGLVGSKDANKVEAADNSYVISVADFATATSTGTGTSYQTTMKEATIDGLPMAMNNYIGSKGQVRGNKTTVAENFYAFNTSATANPITKIELSLGSDTEGSFSAAMYASVGTASQSGVTAVTSATKGELATGGLSMSWTFDATSEFTYFKLLSAAKFTAGNASKATITITTASLDVSAPSISITSETPRTMRVGETLDLEVETKNTGDATVEWSVDNDDVASIDANGHVEALSAGSFIATAKINVNGEDYTASTSAITVKEVLVLDHAGTEEDPLSVADALKVCADTGTANSEAYYVKGIVTTVTEISPTYGNATFIVSDTKDAENALTLFRIKYLGNTKFTDENQVEVGDEVVCYGALVNYNNVTPEMVQNSYLTKHTAAADLREEIVWGEEANMLLDKFFYWNDQGWVGSYVAVSESYLANGTAHFTFKTTWQENECPFGFQAFYKNTSLTVGTEYTLTFDLYSTVECEIQINHSGDTLYHVNAGMNHMTVTYTESGQTSFHIAMSSAYALDEDVTLEISNLEWNIPTPSNPQTEADAFLADWDALRNEEGSICDNLEDPTALKEMLARYDALDEEVKAIVDEALDRHGNTVKSSVEYLKAMLAAQEEANIEQTTMGTLLTVAKEHKSSIAIIVALIAMSFVGYIVLNKKRNLVK